MHLHLPSSLCTFPQKNTVSIYFKSNEDDFSQLWLGIKTHFPLTLLEILEVGVSTQTPLLTCWQRHICLLACQQHVGKCLTTMSSKYVNQTILLTCQQDVSQHVADILANSFGHKENIPKLYRNHVIICTCLWKSCEKGFALIHL